MEIISNAKEIATKAWSVRLASLTVLFSTLEALQPLLQIVVPAGTFAILSALMALATIASRFIKQENLAAALANVQVALDGNE
jgi:hypothetical protein